MDIQTLEVLSVGDAKAALYARHQEIRRWTTTAILKMAMPSARTCGTACAVESVPVGARSPSASAVRQDLLRDEELCSEIELKVIESFLKHIAARPFRESEVSPYLYRITERVARKLARREARKRLSQVHFGPDGADLGDALSGVEPLPDALFESREMRARLGAVLMRFTPRELLLLEASVTRRYDEAAAECGISRQTAKNQACLLRKSLREALFD